jgi:hypothetical protein
MTWSPDNPVQAVLGHQVDMPSEQLLQVRLQSEERKPLGSLRSRRT